MKAEDVESIQQRFSPSAIIANEEKRERTDDSG